MHVLCGFDGRGGSKVSMCFFFPWVVLAATTLVEVGLEMEGLKPEPGVS